MPSCWTGAQQWRRNGRLQFSAPLSIAVTMLPPHHSSNLPLRRLFQTPRSTASHRPDRVTAAAPTALGVPPFSLQIALCPIPPLAQCTQTLGAECACSPGHFATPVSTPCPFLFLRSPGTNTGLPILCCVKPYLCCPREAHRVCRRSREPSQVLKYLPLSRLLRADLISFAFCINMVRQ